MTTPKIAIQRLGRRTITAIATMDHPSPQITPANPNGMKKVQANPMTVSQRNTSHKPRVQKNRETSRNCFCRRKLHELRFVPAARKNTGAQ